MQVSAGETTTLEVRGTTINAIEFNCVVQHGTVNTAFSGVKAIDLTKVNIQATLKRGGKAHNIMQDAVFPLAAATSMLESSLKYLNTADAWEESVTQTASLDHIVVVPARINLPSVINVKGDDVLEVRVRVESDAFDSNADTSASFIEFYANEAIGEEVMIPSLFSKTIQGGQSREEINVGSLVESLYYINADKTDRLDASQVIEQAVLSSTFVKYTKNFKQLFNKTIDLLPSENELQYLDQCLCLHSSATPTNKVSLDLTLSATNNNAGKNWIVAAQFIKDGTTLRRFQKMRAKHNQENAQMLMS